MPRSVKKQSVANKHSQSHDDEIAILNNRILELEKENTLLKENKKRFTLRKYLKKLAIFFLVLLSAISLFLLNYAFWVKNTMVDNEAFVATTAPIIKNPEVQKVISVQLSDQIFTNVDVEAILAENLPERATFLAEPLAGQIQGFVTSRINNVLASEQVASLWTQILSTSQKSIIEYLSDESNQGTINVDQLYSFMSQSLGDSQLSFLLNRNLPAKFGQIQIADIAWVPQARSYLNVIKGLPAVLTIIFLVCVLLAVLITKRKRHLLIITSSLSILVMLISMLLINLAKGEIANQVKPQNKAAAQAVYEIITAPLVDQTIGLLWLFIAALIILILISPYGWVQFLSNKFRQGLDWIMSKILPASFNPPQFLKYIAKNRFIIVCAFVTAWFVAFALRLPPTRNGVLSALIASSITLFAIECLASIGKHKKV